jgi:hypothetical protein
MTWANIKNIRTLRLTYIDRWRRSRWLLVLCRLLRRARVTGGSVGRLLLKAAAVRLGAAGAWQSRFRGGRGCRSWRLLVLADPVLALEAAAAGGQRCFAHRPHAQTLGLRVRPREQLLFARLLDGREGAEWRFLTSWWRRSPWVGLPRAKTRDWHQPENNLSGFYFSLPYDALKRVQFPLKIISRLKSLLIILSKF